MSSNHLHITFYNSNNIRLYQHSSCNKMSSRIISFYSIRHHLHHLFKQTDNNRNLHYQTNNKFYLRSNRIIFSINNNIIVFLIFFPTPHRPINTLNNFNSKIIIISLPALNNNNNSSCPHPKRIQ